MDVNDARPDAAGPAEPTEPPAAALGPISRRRALALGGMAGLVPLIEWQAPALAEAATPTAVAAVKVRPFDALSRRRRRTSFDDGWSFHRGALSGAEASSFDDGDWRVVNTPHDWSIEDLPDPTSSDGGATADPTGWAVPSNAPTRIGPFDATATDAGRSQAWTIGGEGWYRKHFRLSGLHAEEQIEITFDGVYQNSDVWLNGNHLGFHPYGYTAFTYDLTPYLVPGDNVLAVRARNQGQTSRWYSGSGIYRQVWLSRSNPVRIPANGVSVVAHDVSARAATLAVHATVENRREREQRARVQVVLLDARGRRVASATTQARQIAAGSEHGYRLNLVVERPQLWSLEKPHLYTVRTEVVSGGGVVDAADTVTGVRSIRISPERGFQLNGTTIKMRGANVHHDLGAVGAAAFAEAEERRLRIMKESGFNAVRTSHNPASTAFLDACDRLGLLVVEEAFDMWDNHKRADDYATYFDEWGERDLTSMVVRDRNHPSVVMWSTGNEIGRPTATGPNPSVAKYGRRLADLVRSLDPSRPVTQGSAMGQAFFFTLADDAADWDYLDLADVHYQNDLATTSHNSVLPLHEGHPEKALVVGEAWHQEIYDDWKSVTDHTWAIGTFSWTGWDYLGESGAGIPRLFDVTDPPARISIPDPGFPWISSFQGDHDLTGEPKPQLYWKRVVWGLSDLEMAVERPTPEGKEQRAVGWSYYDELQSWTWSVPVGQPMKLRVYSSGDRVRVLLNGRQVDERSLSANDKQVTTFTVPYEPGTLTVVASADGRTVGRRTFRTAGPAAALRLSTDDRRLSSEVSDLAYVKVEVVDARGRLVPDAVAQVTFDLDGPAELLGTVNGNPRNVDSFQLPRRHTYHGQVLAVLRGAAGGGRTTLVARSAGLRRGRIRL